ncbi:hypothetical protein BH10CYA1_BH10CYA1_20270 [soil metagenome]
MKSKNVLLSLAIALSAVASCGIAQAQVGGAPASGDVYDSSGSQGYLGGQDTYLNTGHEAKKLYNPRAQNYISPNTATPGMDDHTSFQTPRVEPMVNPGRGGLNQVSTAPMAPGTTTIGNTPFPSGSFNYGFDNGAVKPYMGAYPKTGGSPGGAYGGMLPNVSLGSVDFNTVDMSGIAPAGMRSPGRGMGAPIGRPVVQIPNSTSSTQSTLDWLRNSFFGN